MGCIMGLDSRVRVRVRIWELFPTLTLIFYTDESQIRVTNINSIKFCYLLELSLTLRWKKQANIKFCSHNRPGIKQ